MDNEIWKPVITWKRGVKFDYTGKYEVSNLGRVRSLNWRQTAKTVIMKPQNNGNNYLHIGFRNGGNKEMFYLHRIVWEAFNGKIPEEMEINHNDENPQNCSLSNLSLATRVENLNYGNHRVNQSLSQKNNRVTSKQINQYSLNGAFIKQYPSQMAVQRETGIPASNISMCCTGKIKTAGGFVFRFNKQSY